MKTDKIISVLKEKAKDVKPAACSYIVVEDSDGFEIEQLDGDYCPECAEKVAEKKNKRLRKRRLVAVEETSPEDEYFRHCCECGAILDNLIIMHAAHDEVDEAVYDIERCRTLDEISDLLAYKLLTLLEDCDMKELYPKQYESITKKLQDMERRLNKAKTDLI